MTTHPWEKGVRVFVTTVPKSLYIVKCDEEKVVENNKIV